MSRIQGNYHGTICDEDYTIKYTADVSADYVYIPGRMYMRNGDPGYPDDEYYDNLVVNNITEIHIFDKATEEELLDFEARNYVDACLDNAKACADPDDCIWDED